eukprot:7286908-Lingulodinium_polyedra.AAC.1
MSGVGLIDRLRYHQSAPAGAQACLGSTQSAITCDALLQRARFRSEHCFPSKAVNTASRTSQGTRG